MRESDLHTYRCDECGQLLKAEESPFDYTQLAGLCPKEYTVLLRGIRVYRCACGLTPEIPNIEGLHYALATALITTDEPLGGSAVRFLRQTLGMTQVKFAERCRISPEYLSGVENGRKTLRPQSDTHVRLVFLGELLRRPDIDQHFAMPDLKEVIKKLSERVSEVVRDLRETIEIENEGCPPAWMIKDLKDPNNDCSPLH